MISSAYYHTWRISYDELKLTTIIMLQTWYNMFELYLKLISSQFHIESENADEPKKVISSAF